MRFLPLFFGICFCLSSPVPTTAQQSAGALSSVVKKRLRAAEDSLAVLAVTVVNDSLEARRQAACEHLLEGLQACLKEENAFRYPFSGMTSVSILAPPDSSFRIFTWQMFVNDSTYAYFGLIQMNRPTGEVFLLTDRSADMEPPPVYEPLSADQWYGLLYYKLYPFDTPQGRRYLLMGYDGYSFFEKRKIIDVLYFDKSGQPVFGAPVFERPGRQTGREHRMVFEYSAEARVRVNWDDEYRMILFDHIIPLANPYRPGVTFVPDGSYDGLRLEKGRWLYVDKVFNDVQEEAPRPVPILEGSRGKDIMGRKRKD